MNLLLKCITVTVIGCILLFSDVCTLQNVHIQVPALVCEGKPAIISCLYDLEGDNLYSIQWYKNKVKFYMFTPDDVEDNLHVETLSNTTQVYNIKTADGKYNISHIVLFNMGPGSSGKYSCTVTSTKSTGPVPTFMSAYDEGVMPVADDILFFTTYREELVTNATLNSATEDISSRLEAKKLQQNQEKEYLTDGTAGTERTNFTATFKNGCNMYNFDKRRQEILYEKQSNILSEIASYQKVMSEAVTRLVDVQMGKKSGSATSQTTPCTSPYVQVGKNCYFISANCNGCSKNWFAAKQDCMQNRNGVIAMLDSPEKINFMRKYLQDNYKSSDFFWIGGSCLANVGTWVWDPTSKPILYTDWAIRQPDYFLDREQCLQLRGGGDYNFQWNDNTCTSDARYICQAVSDTI